ncbi:MAG: GtrA family protein [Candidatus Thiodiazotropha sp.]
MSYSSLRSLVEKAVSLQFSRYLLVGIAAWIIDFVVFVLSHAAIGVVWAQTAARASGAVAAFAGHKVFVYNNRNFTRRELGKQAFGYLLLWVFSYLLSVGCIILFIDKLGLDPIPAKLATEIILIGINYITMKRLIFLS